VLGVLSGAPAVAVICAGLCLPATHHEQAQHADPSCHGQTGHGPAMTGQPAPDCGDHGLTTIAALASSMASRAIDDAAMHPVEADLVDAFVLFPSMGQVLTSFAGTAAPPRPTRSSLVLRICSGPDVPVRPRRCDPCRHRR
jgi:hypothetical protein